MILTDKTKEDFINYLWNSNFKKEDYKEYECYLDNQKENHTHSDIIEWFDSVGIYINISPRYIGHDLKYSLGDFYATINFKDLRPTINGFNYNNIDDTIYNRQEATKQAILKANQIYNELPR